MTSTLNAIRIYPIKSTAGQPLEQSSVEPMGLTGDRRWMVVDDQDRFLTGRRFPILTQVQARLSGSGLTIAAPGRSELNVPRPGSNQRRVRVWKDEVPCHDAGPAAARWFSDLLAHPCRLVHMGDEHLRPVDAAYSRPDDRVSFADGFPLLLISEGSLAALNQRLDEPVSMWRFRPNLVVGGCEPFAEDRWKRIAIGEVEFEVAKPCARCVFTTVDPENATRHPLGEPLKTLTAFRRDPERGVLFGQNLVARGRGMLQHGDPVRVLEASEPAYRLQAAAPPGG